MATYVYETIPQKEGDAPEQFELQQSMKDAPLTQHPETGVPVRRLISGGLGITGSSKQGAASGQSSCCGGSNCGCH
jgi:predicted nucleic acid-binding Zn ribbon protein